MCVQSTTIRSRTRRGLLASLVLFTACADDVTVVSEPPPPPQPVPEVHPQVVLRDVFGEPLPADAKEPYSPRATCGRCHDVDAIAEAYHFQQGRIDAAGRIDSRLTRPWQSQVAVLSPGMFGKW